MERIPTTHKVFVLAASVVVGVYLSLALGAFFCATTHVSHHGQQASHSALCTWACQANNSVSLISLVSPAVPFFMALLTVELLASSPLPTPQVFHAPRGPPYY